jgi:hypothetical protein
MNDEIDLWRRRAFAWGSADCIQFTAAIITAITGIDYRGKFPAYSLEDEAQVILVANGGMLGLLTAALEVEQKPVAWAHRGDVIAAELANGMTAGICLGVQSCAMDRNGLSFFPTSRAAAAWSV